MRHRGQWPSNLTYQFNLIRKLIHRFDCVIVNDMARPRFIKEVNISTGNNTNDSPSIRRDVPSFSADNQEKWQVLRYEPGQQYTAHFDACNEDTKEFHDCVANEENKGWGKRVYTFFIYLNDVEEGGETYFPLLDKGFKPKKATAILWNNLTDDQSKSHPYSKHDGNACKKRRQMGNQRMDSPISQKQKLI